MKELILLTFFAWRANFLMPLHFWRDPMHTTIDDGNAEGIKGCSYIYAPRGQAGEYAPLATNPYRGCGHKCAYCYVPKVLRLDRGTFDAGARIRPTFQAGLLRDAKKYKAAKCHGQVMLSFTTDPYPPEHHDLTSWTLKQLRDHGLGFCTLTKGGSRALRDIHLFRPDRDAFASTLTSLDRAVSRKWERGAADPADRIATLRAFHDRGIFTWVSLEPTLDCDTSIAIIEATHHFVDLYKVGRVNYIGITKTTDWHAYTLRIIEKMNAIKKAHYIKKDLQKYLPPGYHNPLRVPQHH